MTEHDSAPDTIQRYAGYPRSERQRRLLALAAPLAERFAARALAHDADASFPLENIADLRESGLLALTVPETYGGLGANELEHTLVIERLAWGDASTALALGMHLSNIGQMAEGGLWPERFPALCREIVEDGAMLNAAQAEPELGSPSHGGVPATTAQPDPAGDWRITGRKIYTTGAPALRYFLVLAALDEPGEPVRLGSFLVPSDALGLRIEKTWDAMALRASGSDDLVLEDARVGADALLDVRPVGAPDPRAALGLPWGALTLGAIYTGVALAARDEAVHFAATRIPTALGKPIGELPTVRQKLGEIEALLLASHRLLYGLAADWVETPELRPVLRAQGGLVKSITTNNAVRVTDLALRITGGAGLQREPMRLERLFRDARAGLINAPPDDTTLQNAGRAAVEGR
ncbi:MAG: Acyl-CoA dehydrogenase [Ktedonobacterales bacterium]|jgi:alkylation response protein AidB-like acyl-CoA dehydrogenase|nr:MAG: Acyl-CoA dehydrogenase [Ktedonobacterales bacterium]